MTRSNDRIPEDQLGHLYAPDAERAVLGAVLKEPVLVDRVLPELAAPECFSTLRHRLIFQIICQLTAEDVRFDVTTVAEELRSQGKLDKAGGRTYLAELMDDIGSTARIDDHIRIVREKATLRKITAMGQELAALGKQPGAEAEQLLDFAERALLSLTESTDTGMPTVKDQVCTYVDRLLSGEAIANPEDIIVTRIADLDKFLGGGLFKGDMVIVAGPPSMGKSSLALDLCHFNATLGRNSLYFALDETQQAIVQRLLSCETQLSREQFTQYHYSDHQKSILIQAKQAILQQRGDVFLCDKANMTVIELRSHARRIHRERGVDIIVVDYLGLLLPPPSIKSDNRNLVVSENSRLLKAIAKELNVVMVVVSQLNRGYAALAFDPGRRKMGLPTQSMLRDSGQIEADANVILFPWRPLEALRKRGLGSGDRWFDEECAKNPDPIENAVIIVGKNKTGPTGQVKAKFNAARMMFFSQFGGEAE